MRKILVSIILATTALSAAPALAAHPHGDRSGYDHRYDRDDRRWDDRRSDDRRWDDREWDRGPSRRAVGQLLRDLDRVEDRIHRSMQRRTISPREGVSLRREANQIRSRLYRSGRNGLSGREFAQLQRQVNRLEQRLRHERRDRDRRRW